MPQRPTTINRHSLESLNTSLKEILGEATEDTIFQPKNDVRFECHCQKLVAAADAYLKADGNFERKAREGDLRTIADTIRTDILHHDTGKKRLDPSITDLLIAARFMAEEIPAPSRAMAMA